jgi:hypothetical protein
MILDSFYRLCHPHYNGARRLQLSKLFAKYNGAKIYHMYVQNKLARRILPSIMHAVFNI